MKLSDAKKDYYRKLSREEGYRTRSAYKLIQLNTSYQILKAGSTVVDLGSAPGGWLQVAKEAVGKYGKVIGIDISTIEVLDGVTTLHGDIQDMQIVDQLIGIIKGKANTVLSDVSPRVSGLWSLDHNKQITLSRSSLKIATRVLVDGGNAIFKVFEGELLRAFKGEAQRNFTGVLLTKPVASRQQSSELYLVCHGFKTTK